MIVSLVVISACFLAMLVLARECVRDAALRLGCGKSEACVLSILSAVVTGLLTGLLFTMLTGGSL